MEKVEYVAFEELAAPSAQALAQVAVEGGFQSKEWHIQFQTLSTPPPTQPRYGRPTGTTPRCS